MSAEDEFSSDEDDLDYVPSDAEDVSEDELSGEDENVDGEKSSNQKKHKKNKESNSKKKKKGLLTLDEDNGDVPKEGDSDEKDLENGDNLQKQIEEEKREKVVEKEKKKADDLWASFMKDVGGPAKPKTSNSGSSLGSLNSAKKTTVISPKTESLSGAKAESGSDSNSVKKVTITKVFDFAGEEVKVTQQVDATSKEAKVALSSKEKESKESEATKPVQSGVKRSAAGLGSVLGKIGKKTKISTLDKSKLDWNSFKTDEGINEELQIHNRGKSGYIERQQFLQRTDVRQFELEKEMRQSTKKLL